MNKKNPALNLAKAALNILQDKKGVDLKLFDVHETAPFTDYYVLCTGRSHTHMQALANALVDEMAKKGYEITSINGRGSDTWILVDFSFTIVHIFNRESREFYNIERLLSPEKELPVPEDTDD